jgi:NAD+ synthase (glutamine-hydrolysing)
MRVSNPPSPSRLHPALREALAAQRTERAFMARPHAQAKATLLCDYMRAHGLRACVVAVSGGVDSSVVLALAALARGQDGSPIESIVPVLAPVRSAGATGQEDAVERARAACASCGLEGAVVDLTQAHGALRAAVEDGVGLAGEGWAQGQLVAYCRTPAFYYVTSLLTEAGLPAILLGTTNRDEGAYLGYVGKAADGMVDVQLISDLHKGEVVALAQALSLPREVWGAVPTGDMFDGRSDEEVFGAPYDFVELYLGYLCRPESGRAALRASLPPEALAQFEALAARLERLHAHNAHKYLVGQPAVRLEALPSAVPGGWGAP